MVVSKELVDKGGTSLSGHGENAIADIPANLGVNSEVANPRKALDVASIEVDKVIVHQVNSVVTTPECSIILSTTIYCLDTCDLVMGSVQLPFSEKIPMHVSRMGK